MTSPDAKLPSDISGSITSFDSGSLKKASTKEKNPLPSQETIQAEKQHVDLVSGIEHFNKDALHQAKTVESDVLNKIVSHEKAVKNIEAFDKGQLKHAETHEKNVLPDPTEINQEKTIQNISKFDRSKLRRSVTEEKNSLPDKATIEQEKRLSQA